MSKLLLEGLRVLELGGSPGAAFCGKVLAELGARVLLVEPPGGTPTRQTPPFIGHAGVSALHLYIDAGKESGVLDLDALAGRQTLETLAGGVDVVLHSLPPAEAALLGLRPEDGDRSDGRVIAAITAFGMAGPWADTPATELTVAALSGYMNTTGDPGRQPLAPFAHEIEHAAGQVAAIGILAALRARDVDGLGDYVDIALIETSNAALDAPLIGGYEYLGRNLERKGNLTGAFGPLRTKDGFVYVAPIMESGYQGLMIAAERADLLEDPRFADWTLRLVNREALDGAVQAWSRGLTTLEALERVQEMRVPSAAAESMGQLMSDPQIAARGLFQGIDHPQTGVLLYPGAPFRSDAIDTRVERAPLLGEHQATVGEWAGDQETRSSGRLSPSVSLSRPRERGDSGDRSGSAGGRRLPLEGMRVTDLTQVWAGPFATVMLAELGADVVHIESPTRPDMTRFWTVNVDMKGDLWEKSSYFTQHNRGKRSLILDLAHESARDALRRLVSESDLLINNYSRRVMENWGFGYEAMLRENPKLIYVTMPSYGATGPHRDYVSFGDSLQAAAGIVRWRGYGPEEPRRAGSPMPDPYSAYTVTALIVAALKRRDDDGVPVYIDVAQRDATLRLIGEELLAYQATGEEPHQFENEHREWVPHRAYQCAGTDNWVAIVARTDEEWRAICGVMHQPSLAAESRFATVEARRAHRDAVDQALEAWTRGRDAKFVETMMLDAGVPAGVVQRASEILHHPQYLFRDFFPWTEHPVGGRTRLHSTPVFLHGFPHARTNRSGPMFGADTRAVLSEIGYSDAEIATLEAEGAAGGVPDVSGVSIWAE